MSFGFVGRHFEGKIGDEVVAISMITTLPRMTKEDVTPELVALAASVRMTEEEFVEWADSDVKAEWADGEVIVMMATSADHNDLQWWLCTLLRHFVERKKLGRVLGPEFSIRLAKQRRRRTPDVLFVAQARADLIWKNHLEGAPELIIEIVSPESESRDWREKHRDYEAAGVREYWVIDSMSQQTEVYALAQSGAYSRVQEVDGKFISGVVAGS